MIVSLAELKTALGLDAVPSSGDQIDLVRAAVESWFKSETERGFEQATYTTYFDVERGQDFLVLEDWPVDFTGASVEEISRNSSGDWDVSRTWPAEDYDVDAAAGMVESLVGSFPAGKRAVRVSSYKGGYTSAQITSGALDEVRMAKQLVFQLTEKCWRHLKNHNLHLRSENIGDLSTVFERSLSEWEKSMLQRLSRERTPA